MVSTRKVDEHLGEQRTARLPFWEPGLAVAALVSVTLWAQQAAVAPPYQLLESPSALLIRKGGQEIKGDLAIEQDVIPTQALSVQYRFGLASWMELSGRAVYARFIGQGDQRISELEAVAEFNFSANLLAHRAVGYVRLRDALGDPIIAKYHGSLNKVTSVVSRHADGGRDAALGILGRRALAAWAYTAGLEYMRAGNRTYGDFTSDQTAVYTVYFSPEKHFMRDTVMVALENRYTYWSDRGDFYDALPEVRWEFRKDWVLESGVSIPVIGGRQYRYILGLTVQY
jgi:hypothetical protein